MKRTLKESMSIFLAAMFILCGFSGTNLVMKASAQETIASGNCGENIVWERNYTSKTLTITGTGEMRGYDNRYSFAPWYNQRGSIEKIIIDNGVTNIGQYAFYDCYNFKTIEISKTVTTIGKYAFYSCDNLSDLEIPNSVTTIYDHAFTDCDSLTNLEIPDSVTSIGKSAFLWCKGLTNVKFGNGLSSTGESTFHGCVNLKNVELSDCITEIGYGSFYDCDSLTNIEIPISVTEIGWYAFYDCDGFTNIDLPDSVTKIGSYAFSNCDNLKNVKIPANVTYIGSEAFVWNESLETRPSLESIIVAPENTRFSSDDYGALFDGKILLQYPTGNTRTSYSIPDGTTSVYPYAFAFNDTLSVIEVPDSTEVINSCAFAACKELKSIKMNGVQLIDDRAFALCTKLTNVTIGNKIKIIGKGAFGACNALINVTIGNGVQYINEAAFDGCDSIKDVYYAGTQEEWSKINIGNSNEPLINATIHFNCTVEDETTTPTEKGIIKTPSTSKINYGETLILHADFANIPDGATIVWSVNGDGVTIQPSADGKTCAVTSEATGYVEVTAKYVDTDGIEYVSGQEIESKAGIWQIIVSFFKNLFRMDRTIES